MCAKSSSELRLALQATEAHLAPCPPLSQMEARAALALLAGRFRLSVAPRMGDREAVRAAEVMKLTL